MQPKAGNFLQSYVLICIFRLVFGGINDATEVKNFKNFGRSPYNIKRGFITSPKYVGQRIMSKRSLSIAQEGRNLPTGFESTKTEAEIFCPRCKNLPLKPDFADSNTSSKQNSQLTSTMKAFEEDPNDGNFLQPGTKNEEPSGLLKITPEPLKRDEKLVKNKIYRPESSRNSDSNQSGSDTLSDWVALYRFMIGSRKKFSLNSEIQLAKKKDAAKDVDFVNWARRLNDARVDVDPHRIYSKQLDRSNFRRVELVKKPTQDRK